MEFDQAPQFATYSRVCELVGVSALRDVYEELDFVVPPQYEAMPDQRQSITGEVQFAAITATRGIARKLYPCGVCPDQIAIGEEHVYLKTDDRGDSYDHHHVHRACFRADILPLMEYVKLIPMQHSARGNRHHYQKQRNKFRR